jgi:hypothetical protein
MHVTAPSTKMTARRDPTLKYEVVRQFTAYVVQNGGSGEDPQTVEKGAVVWADRNFLEERPRESELVVRFVCNDSWFYVDRQTFFDSTRKA